MEPSDSIQPAAPGRSAERQALADAIERRGAAERALEAGRRAIERAGDVLAKCEGRLQAAHDALGVVREARAFELAEGTEADAPAPTRSTQTARFALADAQDETDAAKAALDKLKGRLPQLEDALRRAGNRVVVAADGVVRSHAGHLLAEAEDVARRLNDLRNLLLFMRSPEITAADVLSTPRLRILSDDFVAQRERTEGFGAIDADIKRFIDASPFHEEEWHRNPVLAPWQAARTAMLDGDADAPLPPI